MDDEPNILVLILGLMAFGVMGYFMYRDLFPSKEEQERRFDFAVGLTKSFVEFYQGIQRLAHHIETQSPNSLSLKDFIVEFQYKLTIRDRKRHSPAIKRIVEAVGGWYVHVPKKDKTLTTPENLAKRFQPLFDHLPDPDLLAEKGPVTMKLGDCFPTEVREEILPFLAYMDSSGELTKDIFEYELHLRLPEQIRTEHHHIVGASGSGKTQCLQHMIAEDIKTDNTVIVIDSQGDLIRNVSRLADIPTDRLVLVDPSDVSYPVALNLFDVGMERIDEYSPLERERAINSIIELYDYVMAGLLGAELTSKQSTAFRFVTRLMLHTEGATIHTLRRLFEPGGTERPEVRKAMSELSETGKAFFRNEFNSKEFESTKKQILRRLYGILENQTFERMFSHRKNKLDLYDEMGQGKVILINAAKDLLKEEGTRIFGRFFIAMIAQAAQERASTTNRRRTYVYIDEFQDYMDDSMAVILSQARKYEVGMVLAHQYIGQLPHKLAGALAANASIKFAGGVSHADARTLAPQMRTDPEFITSKGKGTFAAYFKDMGTVAWKVPFGYMEDMPRKSPDEMHELRETMRVKYCTHVSEIEHSFSSESIDTHEENTTKASEEW